MPKSVNQNVRNVSEFFEEHADTIRAAIKSHVNDKSSVDDIFQDFFLSLTRNPVQQQELNIRAFINRAIRNDVLDAASKARSYHLRNRKYAEMNKDRYLSETPEDIAIRSEETRQLRNEVHQLLDIAKEQLLNHEYEALLQKYRFDKDIKETATAMSINRRSVSRYLCTGLKKLRNVFSQRESLQNNNLSELK